MLTWKLWKGPADAWDALLTGFPDHSVYQGFGWGEHKSGFGWEPWRLTASVDGRTVAMAQALVRRFPLGVALAWVPGGPVGPTEEWAAGFPQALRQATGSRHLYCRVNSISPHTDLAVRALQSQWHRPASPLLSGKSLVLDLALPEGEWLASIDSKHRYYVKRSSSAPIRWIHGESAQLREDFALLTRQLRQEKTADLQEADMRLLDSLSTCLPGSAQILVGYLDGTPVSGCLTLIQREKAHYAMAATVGEGRSLSAAYSMIARLRTHLRECGVTHFDFGGISPQAAGARGVDHFKRGFRGQELQYLGEWDWATSSLLRKAAGYLIKRRAGSIA
jgi:peptidoglycan pentaglycine glycine transferase (the first glycine)